MIPTLLIGDNLFVSKYAYGYSRHSLPFSLPLIPGRVLFSEPERGDVAVFKLPTDNKTDYIKRIISLPGDRIQVKRGILYINDEPVKRERVEDYEARDMFGNLQKAPQYIETLPNGERHRILEIHGDNYGMDNTNVYIVPRGHYFAMGDNRDNSSDSRVPYQVGFVPAKNLVGRATVLFNSHDPRYPDWDPRGIRYHRLFTGVN